ncbi:MAG: thioredoxin family protein [Prevotella sp.]|nr:thioredoxin family protein [Prevotella sp.]
MKKLLSTYLLTMMAAAVMAQIANPVHFSTQVKELKGGEGELVFTATIDPGWHVYSTNLGNDGPISATFNPVKMVGVETVGKLQAQGKEIKQYDKVFDMTLRYFEKAVTFVQKIRFTRPDYDIDCYVEYGACNDQSCLPPSTADLKKKGKAKEVARGEGPEMRGDRPPMPPGGFDGGPDGQRPPHMDGQMPPRPEDGQMPPRPEGATEESKPALPTDNNAVEPIAETDRPDSTAVTAVPDHVEGDLWTPVVSELRDMGGSDDIADHSLLYILLMGFVGGLLAVCMPCIWPIIPMTVSFFLKRAKTDKQKGIRDAVTYGLSIIVIYLGLGLLVTALFGSDTLNAMSTNAVFNIFLFLLLVVFALSFFGWFEIKLPDSWANSVDSKASETSGLISIFLMAFTLVLVSFSCTAPIIGLLLVETTTSGNWLAPALGMFGFALALALPFTLFAMFPSWLKQAPKSGSWMTTIKVVLGFIELAFALKFLSVADLAYGWHLLDREVFLSLWIVIFGLLGAYLCGWLKFQEDEIGGNLNKPMPVVCIMGGLVSLAFAVYMIPGLWGAPCKAVSAFAPPMNTQDFNLNTKVVEAKYKDYDLGMAAARAEGKPVLIDFTGYGCVNCRKMEAAVWTDPTVTDKLTCDFVLISLYVDDKTPLAEPLEVTDAQGQTKTLRTVGAKWSYLQSQKFGANAQPFYVMLDPATGKPLAGSRAYDEDIQAYLDFLNLGLDNYKNR